jgi:hypothetical protein
MKKLLLSLFAVVALGVANIEGATATGNYTTAGTNSLLSVSGSVLSLVIANSAASASTVTVFDSADTTLVATLSAYTNTVTYSTNITDIITTSTGLSQTNVYAGVFTQVTTNAASTPARRIVGTWVVPATDTLTITFGGNGYSLGLGLCVTNSTNANITATYVPDL